MRLRGKRLGLLLAGGTALSIAVLYPPAWSPYDDALVLQEVGMFGPAVLARPYASYLIVVQRAASLLEGPNPLLIGAFFSYAAVLVVGLFLSWRVHPAAPLVLLLAPAVSVYGSLSNIQWVLAVYLLGMLVARPPVGRERIVDGIGIALTGLTGPFAVLLLPLYAIRARNPVWRWHFLVLAMVASLQALVILGSERWPGASPDVVAVMLARATVPVAIILLAGLRLPWPWTAGALYVAVLIPFLGVNATYHTTAEMLAGEGQRYFYLPWIVALGLVGLNLRDADIRGRVIARAARARARDGGAGAGGAADRVRVSRR